MQDYQSLHQGQAANFVKRVSLERLNVKFVFVDWFFCATCRNSSNAHWRLQQ